MVSTMIKEISQSKLRTVYTIIKHFVVCIFINEHISLLEDLVVVGVSIATRVAEWSLACTWLFMENLIPRVEIFCVVTNKGY